MVRINQAGHDEFATSIDRTVGRIAAGIEVANGDYAIAVDINTAILDEAIVVVECGQEAIGDQQRSHILSLFSRE